jgi:hypothetical protein
MRHQLNNSIEDPCSQATVLTKIPTKNVFHFLHNFNATPTHSHTHFSLPPTTQTFRRISETFFSEIQVEKIATFTDGNDSAVEAPNAMQDVFVGM